jgi:hypothetical protein
VIDPFFVYLFGVLFAMLIGWLWWEWRCAVNGFREAIKQRDRARDFAIALSEELDQETGPLLVAMPELAPRLLRRVK